MIFACGSKKKKGKRYFGVFAFLAVMLMSSLAYSAVDVELSQYSELGTYICTNTSTTLYSDTAISTSTITPANHRIIGFTICPYNTGKGSEFVASLYDDTDATDSTTVIDEAEWGATSDKSPKWFPVMKKLGTGLTVRQGPNTVVIVYYVDIRKR